MCKVIAEASDKVSNSKELLEKINFSTAPKRLAQTFLAERIDSPDIGKNSFYWLAAAICNASMANNKEKEGIKVLGAIWDKLIERCRAELLLKYLQVDNGAGVGLDLLISAAANKYKSKLSCMCLLQILIKNPHLEKNWITKIVNNCRDELCEAVIEYAESQENTVKFLQFAIDANTTLGKILRTHTRGLAIGDTKSVQKIETAIKKFQEVNQHSKFFNGKKGQKTGGPVEMELEQMELKN